ncbi:MAG: hypothetical protein ABFS56_10105 [Pseudomonadota bacterium]
MQHDIVKKQQSSNSGYALAVRQCHIVPENCSGAWFVIPFLAAVGGLRSANPPYICDVIKLRATTRDCPYRGPHFMYVGAILYGCP